MVQRHDPGTEPDRPDYRHCRPPSPCEGRVPAIATRDGVPRWCPGFVEVWQRRRWGDDPRVHGPDGWWAWGHWYLEPGRRWGGWLHESEVRPSTAPPKPGSCHGRSDVVVGTFSA